MKGKFKTIITCGTFALLAVFTTIAKADNLSVKQTGHTITIQNNHYIAKLDASANYRITSLRRPEGKELLGFNGIEAAGDYPGKKAYWMRYAKSTGTPKITKTTELYTVQNSFSLLGHVIRQTLVFKAQHEVIEIGYEILATKENYKAGILNLQIGRAHV